MRSRGLLFWVVVLFALVYVSRVYSAPPEFDSVCAIVEQSNGKWGMGSGTLIAVNDTAGLNLTVRHVVGAPGHPEIYLWLNAKGNPTRGVTLENLVDPKDVRWEASDLALTVCHRPRDKAGRYIVPATVASYNPGNGPWYAVGYVDGKLHVMKMSDCDYDGGILKFRTLFIPGMSGGPVFDKKGRIVAVISSYTTYLGQSGAIGGPNLKKILAEYGI